MSNKPSSLIMTMLGLLVLVSACSTSIALAPTAATPVLVPTATSTAAPAAPRNVTRTPIPTPTIAVSTTVTVTTPVTTTPPVTATGVTTQAGIILAAQLLETVAMTEINRLSSGFYPATNLVNAQYAVDVYRLTVQSSDELGAPIDLQADLFIPRATTEKSFPVLAYAPGTTGMGDDCAPSLEYGLGRQWGSYRTHSLSYAGQGFITVLPDGMSYTDPDRPHEYFISELEAHTLLDAARAVYNFFAKPPATVRARPQQALFFAGYSNGGHSAFAAKDFAKAYAPELPLRGVISHGATTNVETLMRESPIFTPYLIYAYRHFFGGEVIEPETVFLDDWLPAFDQDVLTQCVDNIFVDYSNDPAAMYRPEFRTALFNGQLGNRYPLFKAVLDANYAGTFGGFEVPVAFFQGTADYIVTPISQQQFAALLCAKGEPVTYVTLPAVQHATTRQSSFKATMAWMRGLASGQTPQSNCAQITTEQ
jgi:hypothetical protein